jgi:alcohol dehydrogenase (cytochrome c)
LFDAVVDGQPRKLVAQASRNGMFFVLDRTNGKKLLSTQYIPSANWSLGFRPTGEPMPNPRRNRKWAVRSSRHITGRDKLGAALV